jgi:pyruvate kinase
MSLLWGVEPVLVPPINGTAHLVKSSAEAAVKVLQAQPDDVLTIVAGTPYNVSGKTNLIKIEVVQDALKGEAKTFGE